MKCFECNEVESDNAARHYQDTVTGKKYFGTRNFCSDTCENAYCIKMTHKHPQESARFIPIQ